MASSARSSISLATPLTDRNPPFVAQPKLDLGDKPVRPVGYWEKGGWDDRAVDVQVCAAISAGHPIPVSRYPLLRPYNGATGQERRDGGNRYAIGRELGLGKSIANHKKKGDKLIVNGEIRYTRNEKDGRTYYNTEIVADQIEFI